ncbi:phage shock protein C, PspC [Neobacillus bataviensis LMG 21833]|uniref:Phage shock protein C, PspC n=1 Tax=Neobacillus bataviensis LMG 21833 TaxID=1117379 RepID=K6DRS6_9BACI|nr:PspC domain-containing protein [Neobacillus bataviensis]EKN70943.1 phage shock protein C, PspC [Neobacillus bataviensis LMG 21833]
MNKLTKSSKNKSLFGVCAGIAEYYGISPLAVRLLFIFIPISVAIYLILAAFLPEKNAALY